jgi:hypothetical protein
LLPPSRFFKDATDFVSIQLSPPVTGSTIGPPAANLAAVELRHDDGPKQVKTMIIDALRFSDQHGMRTSTPPLDEAD